MTDGSKAYPGFSNCLPSSVGSGCTIVSRMGCLFYRAFFIPDLLRSYEVRSVRGHTCSYTIAVERVFNDTPELITLQSTALTSDGIHLELLGAFNQPQLHITDSLVVRVGDPTEAYLMQASAPNQPRAGQVGQVQANQSFTKDFIFDKNMVECHFFETTLQCQTKPNEMDAMVRSQEHALPLTRDLYLLSIEKGVLTSKLLSSAPVRIQMHFKNFKIFLESNDVCPKISDKEVVTKGCYACHLLSELSFLAHSSCHRGVVSIEFQVLKLFTQTVVLETESKQIVIYFQAENKCYDEKICLVSRTMKICKLISFCLNEPSIQLRKLNTSYTRTFINDDSSGFANFFKFLSLPTMSGIFLSIKIIGATLLIICLSITIFSTCATCCRR